MNLPIYDRSFTWSNLRDKPVLARLDRVMVTAEWESHFPLAILRSLPRPTSDHVPLCLDTREASPLGKKSFILKRCGLKIQAMVLSLKKVGGVPYLGLTP